MLKYSKLIPILKALEDEPRFAVARVLLPGPHDSPDVATAKSTTYLHALVAVPVEEWPPSLLAVRATAIGLLAAADEGGAR